MKSPNVFPFTWWEVQTSEIKTAPFRLMTDYRKQSGNNKQNINLCKNKEKQCAQVAASKMTHSILPIRHTRALLPPTTQHLWTWTETFPPLLCGCTSVTHWRGPRRLTRVQESDADLSFSSCLTGILPSHTKGQVNSDSTLQCLILNSSLLQAFLILAAECPHPLWNLICFIPRKSSRYSRFFNPVNETKGHVI